MGGGLMQLVAYGAQDVYLTGNPQITFFKVVYRRHTNFACEAIEQVFTGSVDFGKKTSCTISRNGDLLGNMYLELDLDIKDANSILNRIGHVLIDYVELEIGGQSIDKHYGEWMDIWTQLTHNKEQAEKLDRLLSGNLTTKNNVRKIYIPLQFWFNRNPGLALPLIALQYHEVKLNIMFKNSKKVIMTNDAGQRITPKINAACLYCDYIFLDTDERRRFAQGSHEYLIEQVQFSGRHSLSPNESTANIELRFNHPCKEIVWLCQDNEASSTDGKYYSPFNYKRLAGIGLDLEAGNRVQPKGPIDQVNTAVLQLNGHDRFRQREGSYFRVVQTYQHHTGGHDQVIDDKGGFYVYSFALKPEEHQPSGTCNFSRIDNAVLTLDVNTSSKKGNQVRVYATNYNVLRIMSGMGGLAYSN
uniref:Major capsid protein N-terminal domain-containing protein n=1 Tax=viral metagenome TaxID=1070528 RepID=A0A6C0EHI6_9ZZZZ